MALTFDSATLTIESTASITDLLAFHFELRDWEDSEAAAVLPVTHSWKALDLGGAFFYQADFINGWKLKFPVAGNYVIIGNLNAVITPVAGVYVERVKSLAFATTYAGSAGVTPADVWSYTNRTLSVEPSSITAAEIRAELSLELSRIDAPISSISGGSLTAQDIRAELAPELYNMDTPVSSRASGTQIIQVDVRKVNGTTLYGTGTDADPWREAL